MCNTVIKINRIYTIYNKNICYNMKIERGD